MRRARPILGILPTCGWTLFLALAGTNAQAADRGYIDAFVAEKIASAAVAPSEPCDDATFVRRAYLDLAGRIPTVAERSEFLAAAEPDKRERLTDRLLADVGFGRHFREIFDAILMGRAPEREREGRGRRRERSTERSLNRRREVGWHEFLERSFNTNRPWDAICRDILLARPETKESRGATWFLFERDNRYQDIAEAIGPVVFGVQVQCAQCHDHPLAKEIEQRHYWGLVAFYNRGKNVMTSAGPQIAESAIGGHNKFADLAGTSSDALLAFLGGKSVDEHRPPEGHKEDDSDSLYRPKNKGATEADKNAPRTPVFSRREEFVEEVFRDHPLVPRAMANRLWGLLIGRGIVHPVDQLDSSHAPSHPALLDRLAEDFRADHDVKRLVRAIVGSETYQRTARPTKDGLDPAFFAHALEKPLTAEQYYRSILVALSQDESPRLDADTFTEFAEAFPDVMPEVFTANVRQSLFLANDTRVERLFAPSEHLAQLAAIANDAGETSATHVVNELFVSFLGRQPQDDERRQIAAAMEKEGTISPQALANLAWALGASAEFRCNH